MTYNSRPPQSRTPQGGGSPAGGRFQHDLPPRQEQNIKAVWPDYLAKGYFGDGATLLPDYVRREPMTRMVEAMANASPPLTSNQLRRFFGHCRVIEAALRSQRATWAEQEAAFYKLDFTAADASGKQPPKIPRIFHDFIAHNIRAVKNEKDFLEGFLPHFEALVGFGSAYFKNERN